MNDRAPAGMDSAARPRPAAAGAVKLPARESDASELPERTSEAPARPGTKRQRAYRARAKAGAAVLRLECDYLGLVDALLASSRLTPAAALDRRRVELAAAEILHEWAQRWLWIDRGSA